MNKTAQIVGLCLIAFLAAMPARADFINGGFEDGTFSGWTTNGGLWYGGIGTYTYTGDQGKSAIVSPGNDPLLASNGVSVPMVYNGNYSARVNNSDPNNHFSTISQSAVWTASHIYFAWSAVLQDPVSGHTHDQEPHFLITLHDDTAASNLYSIVIAVDTVPGTFQETTNFWKYSGWQTVDLDVQAAGAVGHTLTLTCLASDCALGGHGGYVYLDGFGAAPPSSSGDCSLAALIAQIQALSLSKSQKTALIRGLELLHTYAVLIRCHAAQHVVTSLAKRMQKSVRLGRMDDSVYGKLVICINQFIGSCPD